MKSVNIKARIKRNLLDKLSGKYYRDEGSDIIQYLNKNNVKALVGIQQDDGIYTIIGTEKIYYLTPSMTKGEIVIGDFLTILNQVALTFGKSEKYEFIKVNEHDYVWVMNLETMNALWNTMLLLYNAGD
ncbi:hypothetical protein FAZ19_22470 [Sphingobacterium alkalisoli]|uniref:Uncharacterized protein n=1 Tax=Sphingobacterium alkalisoli TaxID=1874115 RepID=A0A4U0GP91_9SPHI|nr:hypothetical protein [Sphingobacterium alkalisoli]TJY60705.1 hypothetical protein FAZ19_22470 [Sphingobacterium alkalisoli]GGH31453.1 hypothetical protein GCM10011418_44270 [Sphingobacterium alkalisoli]